MSAADHELARSPATSASELLQVRSVRLSADRVWIVHLLDSFRPRGGAA